MAIPGHMKITGKKQGKIEGSVDLKGREGSILVQEFDHEISLPVETQGGQPIGQRVHKALTIHKYVDKSSPKLYKAIATGERMSEVTIDWYRIDKDGNEELYFTHKLEDATIVSMKPYMHNALDPEKNQYGHMEEVSFTYRKITWTWKDGGIAAEDDWTDRPTK